MFHKQNISMVTVSMNTFYADYKYNSAVGLCCLLNIKFLARELTILKFPIDYAWGYV